MHFRDCCPSHISDADPLLCTFPLCLSRDPHNESQTAVNAALCLTDPPNGVTRPGLPALQGACFSHGFDAKLGERSKPGDFFSFRQLIGSFFFDLPVGVGCGVEDTWDT